MYDSRLSLGDKTFRWEYDALNRVTNETYPDGNMPDPVSFEYDALGRRLIYTDGDGKQTLYYYDGIRVILEKKKPYYPPTWSTAQVYTLQEGSIGFIISSRDSATGNDTWYHYDRLGTVMNLTNSTGFVTAVYDHDAFGNVLTGSEDGFHLTTKDYNSTIGLYYFYQRWYDPEVGKFLQRDTIPSPNNLYIYCGNNSNNLIDPTGEFEIDHKECKKFEDAYCEINRHDNRSKCEEEVMKLKGRGVKDKYINCMLNICYGVGKKTIITCKKGSTKKCAGNEGYYPEGTKYVVICIPNCKTTAIWGCIAHELCHRCGGNSIDCHK